MKICKYNERHFSGKKTSNTLYAIKGNELMRMWDNRKFVNKTESRIPSSWYTQGFMISNNKERRQKYPLYNQ